MARLKEKKFCYYCGKEATSKEHIPPKCFFPPDNRTGLLTVPSCDEHNSQKSDDDEYVKTLLTTSANVMLRDDLRHVINKSKKAMGRNPFFKQTVLANQEPAFIIYPNNTVDLTTSSEVDLERFFNFFRMLGHGLYFHHTKQIWDGEIRFAPHFFLRDDAPLEDKKKNEELLTLFDDSTKHGQNPNVFYYHFSRCIEDPLNSDEYTKVLLYVLSLCLFDEFKMSLILKPNDNHLISIQR